MNEYQAAEYFDTGNLPYITTTAQQIGLYAKSEVDKKLIELIDAIINDRKLDTIKIIRQNTGNDLYEAKNIADKIFG